MKLKEYKIIASDKSEDLTEKVNKAIKQDWIPQGGVTATLNKDGVVLIQAMVRGFQIKELK